MYKYIACVGDDYLESFTNMKPKIVYHNRPLVACSSSSNASINSDKG